jgi:hypothetical protein
MGKFSDSSAALANSMDNFVTANRASDFIIKRKMVPELRKFLFAQKSVGLSLNPSAQAAHLTEFFNNPTGLKYLAHFRKSSYNSVAGTAKLLYQILTYA